MFVGFPEELTKQRDALIAEIQSMKEQHQQETDTLRATHQGELQSQAEQLRTAAQEEVDRGNGLQQLN